MISILMGSPKKGLAGGIQVSVPFLVSGLRELGVDLVETTYGSTKPDPSHMERIRNVVKTAFVLRRTLKLKRSDVVHLHTAFDKNALLRDVVTVAFLRLAYQGVIFLEFHGSDFGLISTKKIILRLLSHCLYSMVDGIGVLSTEERSNFLTHGAEAGRVFVVKYLIDPSAYRKSADFFSHHDVPANIPILLFTGRFISTKGLLDVIHACAILKAQARDFFLICLGDGPQRGEAEMEVRRSGLEAQVRFTGYIPEENTKEYYANATLLVFPTYHHEGFPMTVLQSVAAGIPIITTRIRAAADYLKEPDNCFWVEPRNPEALARRIQELLNRDDLRYSMSLNNKKLAAQFTQNRVAKEFHEIYQTVIASRNIEQAEVVHH